MTAARFGWLVSYPKSGNTWLRMMLSSLVSGGGPVDINALAVPFGVGTFAEMDEHLGIESSELTAAELASARPALHAAIAADSDAPLILRKVHDRFWLTPPGRPAFQSEISRGAIYLVRDPRDIALSYAHHRGLAVDRAIALMADEAAILAAGDRRMKEQLPQPLGSWSGHVSSWIEQTEIPVLAIRYEDLFDDPARHLASAAAHLAIDCDAKTIDAAVDAARFSVLSAQEKAQGFVERRAGSTAPFFRVGRPGGWRERLSEAQVARISETQRPAMLRFHYF